MKKIYKLKYHSLMLIAFFLTIGLASCEEEVEYKNVHEIEGDINLEYTNLTSYPFLSKIESAEPAFTINTSVYAFRILEVKINGTGDPVTKPPFSIDNKTGQITIDNQKGDLIPGSSYHFNIGVENVNGIIRNDGVFVLNVLDIPLDYEIDKAEVEVGFLFEGEVATFTYVDTSGDNVVDNVSYSLVNAPDGFTIDSNTGVISKTADAASGVHMLSVEITSNVGAKTFNDVLKVTVGEAPAIQYVQQDGTTPLVKVTLSPWTEYLSAKPDLSGMDADGGYTIILPASLPDGLVKVVNSNGKIKINLDADLPLGEHSIGVTVTNGAGVSVDFENLVTLVVETRWDPNPVFFEDFNNADSNVDPNTYNPALFNYNLNGSAHGFVVGHTFNDKPGKEKDLFTAKLSDDAKNNPDEIVDAALVLKLDLQSDWRGMRVAFNEDFGFGSDRLNWYERSLQRAYDVSDLESGNFDESNWTTIMAIDDEDWTADSGWSSIHVDDDLSVVPFKEFSLEPGHANVYLNWRVYKTGPADPKGSAFLFDNIKVEVSKAFAAEEE